MLRLPHSVRFLPNVTSAQTRWPFVILLMALLVQGVGCSSVTDSDDNTPDYSHSYYFNEEPNGWTTLFSNYGVGREDDFELESGYRSLPEPLDTDKSGFYLSGMNHSDDLNMFLKHQVDGLEPEGSYRIAFKVTFATDAPSGCFGVGGPPGEGVTVHAAASSTEPSSTIVDDRWEQGYYRLNFAEDYEGEAHSWYQETKIGDVANSRDCEEGRKYELKTVTGEQASVTADENGNLWLLVGTRSGFEATTSLYYTEVKVLIAER